MTAGAGDFPALRPLLAGTLAPFDLGTRKINFLASAQGRLIRIWHDHPFVCRRERRGPGAAPRFPGDARGEMPGTEEVPGRVRVLARFWQGCGMLTCREQNPSGEMGGPCVFWGLFYFTRSAAALCPAQPCLLQPPPSAVPCCAVGNPGVPTLAQGRGGSRATHLICHPEPRTASRLHRRALALLHRRGLSHLGSARQLCRALEQEKGLRPAGLHPGQRPCPLLLPPLEMVSWWCFGWCFCCWCRSSS